MEKENEGLEVIKVEEHKDIAHALSAFQGELKPIERDGYVEFDTKKGGKVGFKYTTLGKIMEVIYPILGKHGLSVRWVVLEKGIECIVTHADGFVSSGMLPLDLTNSDMKEVGAQITYGRRYTLGLVLGIATEEDKDAEIQEKNTMKLESFAFKKAKENLSSSTNKEELAKQIVFLSEQLLVAKNFEEGKTQLASSLGLTSTLYEELIKIGEDKLKTL